VTDAVEELKQKTMRVFGNASIDKRRLPASQLQKRSVPGYVGEWVLESVVPGTGEMSADEIEKVQDWAEKAIPGPSDQNLIKARLLRGETVKLLTPVQVEICLKRNKQDRVARLSLVGVDDANVTDELLERHPGLLKQGLWGVTELVNTDQGVAIASFRPMQASVDLRMFKEARREFSTTEWRSLLILSMGYSPDAFTTEEQNLLICRLLPLVQKSMHLMELAPKGTGKSYVFENISPMVRLISGGNVSPAVLFVNNATGQPGLLARFCVVVLDEIQTLKFEKPEEIVGGLKGFLANQRLTRGGLHESSSDCGLVMLANIALDENQLPLCDPLIRELPPFLQETAFLDRIKGIIPGWEIGKLNVASFAQSVGLKSDFFGDTLIELRYDLMGDDIASRRFRLIGDRPYKRNEEAVKAIASGLIKLLFPHGEVSDADLCRYCILPAVKLRQAVWDQLYRLDSEYRQFEREIRWELRSDN